MSATHTIAVEDAVRPGRIAADKLGYFRFGRLGDRMILTNEFGEWHTLDAAGFRMLVEGGIDAAHADYEPLAAKGFLRAGLDLQHVAQAMRRRKRFVGIGPTVHVVRLSEADRRLSVETAKDILDFAMLSTATALELRLEPGPQPLDLDQIGFLVQYGTEKNRYEGKALTWRLAIDPASLDAPTATWLVDKRFKVRAPRSAPLSEATRAGIVRLTEAAAARRREGGVVEVDVHVDRHNVARLPEVAAELRAAGIARFRVQPVLLGEDAVSGSAFAAAYGALLTQLLDQGGPVEELAAAAVTSALRTDPSADVAHRSPTSAGNAVVAYDLDGRIFPGVHAFHTPDPEMFVLGKAGVTAYKEATRHPTLRALTVASLLECMPAFADHWATPFLGVDPLLAFAATGDLFTKAASSPEVAVQLAVIEAVFAILAGSDTQTVEQLTAWAEG